MSDKVKINFEHFEFVDTHVCVKLQITSEKQQIYDLLQMRRNSKNKIMWNDFIQKEYKDLCTYRKLDHKFDVICAKRRKQGYLY